VVSATTNCSADARAAKPKTSKLAAPAFSLRIDVFAIALGTSSR
jgi:hypothetical protein